MSEIPNSKKVKKIFSSHFTFAILSKLYQDYRPSQIAEQLGVTPQDIYYYTDRMIESDLIYKDKSNGIKWKLTEKGTFILKQKLTGSVNSFKNYQTRPVVRYIPTRLENLCFEFKVFNSIPQDSYLHWSEIKNGVSKCSLKHDSHTVEFIKSEKCSFILIHLNKKYCFDWSCELINQHITAICYAKQTATKFGLQISDYGRILKRPHIAFEQDLVASFLAASYTEEITTEEGDDSYKTWVDSSSGTGELETNDYEYGYDYLMMPKYVREILDMITKVTNHTKAGFERHYHPVLTINN